MNFCQYSIKKRMYIHTKMEISKSKREFSKKPVNKTRCKNYPSYPKQVNVTCMKYKLFLQTSNICISYIYIRD